MSKCSYSGFTLLETLLAMTIFTLVSLAIYQSLIIVAKGSEVVNNKAKQIHKLQIAINMLENNISHATKVSQPIDKKSSEHSFRVAKLLLGSDDFGIYLSLNTNTDSLYYIKSEKIGFRLKNRCLEKLIYDSNENNPRVSKILEGVTGFSMRIYHETAWLNEWSEKDSLPKAVEIIIELGNQGTVRRVITLLNSHY